MFESTPLYGGNAEFLELLYEAYLRDPSSVEPRWREYFAGIAPGGEPARGVRDFPALRRDDEGSAKQAAVSRLIQIWINRGHLVAKLDPLGLTQRPRPHVLDLEYFGLGHADLDTEFVTGSRTEAIPRRMKLRDIIAQLEYIYGGTIGAEFAHVSNSDERLWLQDQFQSGRIMHRFTAEERRNILWQITAAEGLERYLHTKYVGQKRFSLEGGEALIPLLDDLIQRSGIAGVEEGVIGMAHRGRLNVLVNLLGKSPSVMFSEFENKYETSQVRGSGDVKYHKGF
jgi:2-oxoglutarate dehydrogenase E1 component